MSYTTRYFATPNVYALLKDNNGDRKIPDREINSVLQGAIKCARNPLPKEEPEVRVFSLRSPIRARVAWEEDVYVITFYLEGDCFSDLEDDCIALHFDL